MQWILFGPICFSLFFVTVFMLATTIRIAYIPIVGEDWRTSFGTRLMHMTVILGFLLVYMNTLVAAMALNFQAQELKPQYAGGLRDYVMCILTTTGNTADCENSHPLNLNLYWYSSISESLPGLGYAIVYLIFKSNARSKVIASFSSRSSKNSESN